MAIYLWLLTSFFPLVWLLTHNLIFLLADLPDWHLRDLRFLCWAKGMMGSLQIRTMEIIDGLMKSVDQNVFLHFPFSFVASMAIKMWSSNSCAFEVTPDTPVFVSVIRTCFMCVKPVNSVNFWHAPDFLFNWWEWNTLFMIICLRLQLNFLKHCKKYSDLPFFYARV